MPVVLGQWGAMECPPQLREEGSCTSGVGKVFTLHDVMQWGVTSHYYHAGCLMRSHITCHCKTLTSQHIIYMPAVIIGYTTQTFGSVTTKWIQLWYTHQYVSVLNVPRSRFGTENSAVQCYVAT